MMYNYVIIMYCRANTAGTFYNFLIILNVRMTHAKNCEKLPKFVKVTAKIVSVIFIRTQCKKLTYSKCQTYAILIICVVNLLHFKSFLLI